MVVPINEDRHLFEALTRHNYFPNQKEGESELPPCFSTRTFTPEAAIEVAKVKHSARVNKKIGYDMVEYSLTRFNNVPRVLGLCHPKPYSELVIALVEHWSKIRGFVSSELSIIKPEQHQDGRILIMNHEDPSDRFERSCVHSFGKKVKVRADVSSCFHSIYSHSIPWAIAGFDKAKSSIGKYSKNKPWYDELDFRVRSTKRNETQGIPIGPATSNIVVEIVLG